MVGHPPGRGRVRGLAVELDHHALLAPQRIDPVAPDPHVGLRQRQAEALAHQQELVLERRLGLRQFRKVVRKGLTQRPTPRPALPHHRLELFEVDQVSVVRLGQGLPHLVDRGVGGEVKQCAGHRRDRKAVVENTVQTPRVVQRDPVHRASPDRDAQMNPGRGPRDQLPPVRGGSVAQRCAIAAVEQRRHQSTGWSDHGVPHGVDARVAAMQPAGCHPAPNRKPIESARPELRLLDDALPPRRNPRNAKRCRNVAVSATLGQRFVHGEDVNPAARRSAPARVGWACGRSRGHVRPVSPAWDDDDVRQPGFDRVADAGGFPR